MKKFFEKYREIIIYVIVGVLTTVVAYGVRFAVLYPGAAMFGIDLSASEGAELTRASTLRTVAVTVGWVAGVIFAFFLNKKWVFLDTLKGRAVWKQFWKFFLSRAATFVFEWGIGVFFPMLLLAMNYEPFRFIIDITADILTTVISMVVVTILNYILSKLLVFNKNNKKSNKTEISE